MFALAIGMRLVLMALGAGALLVVFGILLKGGRFYDGPPDAPAS